MPMESWARKTRGIIRKGTRALQPLATDVLEGTLYYVTDESKAERSNGTIWESYSAVIGGFTATRIPYASAGGILVDDPDMVFDGTNVILNSWVRVAAAGVPDGSFIDGFDFGGFKMVGYDNATGYEACFGGYRVSQWKTLGLFTAGVKALHIDITQKIGIGVTPTRILSLKAGSSTGLAQVGGVIADFFTTVTVGGAETDIYSTTIPASVLATDGDKLTAMWGGNFVSTSTEQDQLKVYFGGTVIFDNTVGPPVGTNGWCVLVDIIRVSATVIRYSVAQQYLQGFHTTGELTGLTLTNTNILKVTGTSSGVGSGVGDILGLLGYVEWKPAA